MGECAWTLSSHSTAKISEQLQRLEHAIFSGFTHEPKVQLGQNVGLKRLPSNQSKYFIQTMVPTAVEGIKMAFQYWNKQRT